MFMNVRGGIEWDRKVSCTRGKSQSLKWYIFAYQGSLKGLNENKNGCKACDDKQVSAKTRFLKYNRIIFILSISFNYMKYFKT